MRKPTTVLAILPLLAVLAAPAVHAEHEVSRHAKKRLLRLADEVADSARVAHRTASGHHDRHNRWGRGGGHGRHGFYGPRDNYTLGLLSNLELRAHEFERALQRRPIFHTHREYEALNRAFERAAEALYRTRVSPAVERDFDCVAEYLYSLNGLYEEVAYPRRARYRPDYRDPRRPGRYDSRVEVYGPRWNVTWRHDGWRGYDRDWDSDSDSDSY